MSAARSRLIAVMIVLAVASMEGYQWIARKAFRARAVSAFKQGCCIWDACFAYASANDGHFPASDTNSNDALRNLFRAGMVDDEKVFWVGGSAWCSSKPDGELGTAEDGYAKALTKGENHWALTSGLTDKADPLTPALMDGFTETVGQWCKDPAQKGGVWQGKLAVIITLSGSSKFKTQLTDVDESCKPSRMDGPSKINPLDLVPRVPGAKLLNPL